MTTTTNLGLTKPTVGADENDWGDLLNADLDIIDTLGGLFTGYLTGLTLSTAGSSSSFGIAAGSAGASNSPGLMSLGSAYTKTTGSWVVGSGNGALDTGAIANNAWYHTYLIKRPDTGVVDVLLSLNPTTPTALPANYTLYRRIGAMKTNGSAKWILFTQNGDEFLWSVPLLDVSATANLPTTAILEPLTVPPGVIVNALIAGAFGNTGAAVALLITTPSSADTAPVVNALGMTAGTAAVLPFGQMSVQTDTSGQIRIRVTGNVNSSLFVTTMGWIDRRGRDG